MNMSKRPQSIDLSKYQYLNEPDAIVTAAICCEYQLIEHLVAQGVDVDTRDGYGRTALMIAVDERNDGLVKFLLNNGADPNAADNDGDSPLDIARYIKDTDIIEILIGFGAIGKDGPSRRELIDDEIYKALDVANAIKFIHQKNDAD